MTIGHNEPSETSPLLSNPIESALEPGDAPNGVLPSGNGPNGYANGIVRPDVEEGSQVGERNVPYQGMPEVKKNLKYIVPSVAIGVCYICQIVDDQLLRIARYFFLLATKPSSYRAMAKLVAI